MLKGPKRIAKQLNRWWVHRQIERLGLIECFRGYPAEAIPPKYHQLYGLYRLARRRKPEVIVELGGGYSTFALAKACRDLHMAGHHARLYSVDQSAHWQEIVQMHMPSHLMAYVTFHRADVTGQVPGFASLPVDKANFVFVDGGGLTDSIRLEERAPKDYAILVDGRKGTVEYLKRNLRGNYAIKPWMRTQTLFILQRTRSPN